MSKWLNLLFKIYSIKCDMKFCPQLFQKWFTGWINKTRLIIRGFSLSFHREVNIIPLCSLKQNYILQTYKWTSEIGPEYPKITKIQVFHKLYTSFKYNYVSNQHIPRILEFTHKTVIFTYKRILHSIPVNQNYSEIKSSVETATSVIGVRKSKRNSTVKSNHFLYSRIQVSLIRNHIHALIQII